jgi:hypothetical protein
MSSPADSPETTGSLRSETESGREPGLPMITTAAPQRLSVPGWRKTSPKDLSAARYTGSPTS